LVKVEVWVFVVGFFRWVYPKKTTRLFGGFFGYVLMCLNPGMLPGDLELRECTVLLEGAFHKLL